MTISVSDLNINNKTKSGRNDANTDTLQDWKKIQEKTKSVKANPDIQMAKEIINETKVAVKVADRQLTMSKLDGDDLKKIIKVAQRQLTVNVTGKWSPADKVALEKYQAQNGLKVDGDLGPESLNMLLKNPVSAKSYVGVMNRYGINLNVPNKHVVTKTVASGIAKIKYDPSHHSLSTQNQRLTDLRYQAGLNQRRKFTTQSQQPQREKGAWEGIAEGGKQIGNGLLDGGKQIGSGLLNVGVSFVKGAVGMGRFVGNELSPENTKHARYYIRGERYNPEQVIRYAEDRLGLEETGKFDKVLRDRIKQFQQSHRGLKVTGNLDKDTVERMLTTRN